jgi:hypothetical protein
MSDLPPRAVPPPAAPRPGKRQQLGSSIGPFSIPGLDVSELELERIRSSGQLRTSTTTLPNGDVRETKTNLLGEIVSSRIVSARAPEPPAPVFQATQPPPPTAATDPPPPDPLSIAEPGLPKISVEELEDRESGFDVFDEIDTATGGAARELDVLVNEQLGGQSGETISARVGRREGPVSSTIADALDVIAPGHTSAAALARANEFWPCITPDTRRQAADAFCRRKSR